MHAVLTPGTILGTATGLTLGTTLGEIPSIITTDDQVGTGDGAWAGTTLHGTVDTTGDGIWALAILLGIVDITGGIEMVSGMATIGALEITTMILTTEATTAGPKMYTLMEDGPTNPIKALTIMANATMINMQVAVPLPLLQLAINMQEALIGVTQKADLPTTPFPTTMAEEGGRVTREASLAGMSWDK